MIMNATQFFTVLILIGWTKSDMTSDDQCCYFYGSVPRNESNCIPEGITQLTLNYIVISPRDNFTNLTVKWFRNADMARAATATEEITNNYDLATKSASEIVGNCTVGPLYRDTFILVLYNFTSELNGYYWCQFVVNGSISQPSQYAWFYAADSSSCRQQSHFKIAFIPQCAEFNHNNYSTSTIYPTAMMDSLDTSGTTTSTVPSTTTSAEAGNELLYYVAGFLSLFSLLLLSLVVLLLFLYYCKQRRKPHPQKKGSSGLLDGHSDNHNSISLDTSADTSARQTQTRIHPNMVTISKEDAFYSVVNDRPSTGNLLPRQSFDNQKDHMYDSAEFESKGATHRATDIKLSSESAVYDTIDEIENKHNIHRKQQDVRDYETIAPNYDTVNERARDTEGEEESVRIFDNIIYNSCQMVPENAATQQERRKEDIMRQPSHTETENQIFTTSHHVSTNNTNKEVEYAEPDLMYQESHIQDQCTAPDSDHLILSHSRTTCSN